MIAVAQALHRTGHTVIVLGQPSIEARAVAVGAEFVPFTHLPDYDRHVALEAQIDVIVPALTGPEVGHDLLDVARRHDVHVTLTDANLAGALAAAEGLDRPSAVLLHSMYRTYVDVWMGEVWPLLGDLVNATRTSFGVGPAHRWPDLFRAHDRLVPVVPATFDAPTESPAAPSDHFGFLVPDAVAEPVPFPDGIGPKVLVGLSTTYMDQAGLLRSIVDALATIAARGIVTTGAAVDPAGITAPDGVTVTDWVDHAAVLPDADVMVSHAGLASVAGALHAGVPIVATPIGRDQPLNAEQVERLGVGVSVPPDAGADAIASAIRRVASDTGIHDAARALALASARSGGAAGVARSLVALAARC
jgi:UDP:flavonoid glycosyltransferase YjiC (YdhE family)